MAAIRSSQKSGEIDEIEDLALVAGCFVDLSAAYVLTANIRWQMEGDLTFVLEMDILKTFVEIGIMHKATAYCER